ncbi:unnamed protein product [Effrenium voratum]|uniref:Uncharacterized protein n=1 Tax=Effrenium voratum TaxID=2562239 RepID=A0AA36J4T4_9DINO|nr:unnamed protein product [Effrenium voratum]
MPTRTSTLPINEINLSGNSLLTAPAPSEHAAAIKANLKRRAETVQLIVQFVRVSTEARKVIFDNCNLEGFSHDKDDLIELEIVRLVKKFGAGKHSRYAEHVSLAGNRFGQEFCRRIIEGAYWERNRADGKDLPKLYLNLSRNCIAQPEKIVEELKEGRTAGGPMSLATTTDPDAIQRDALIVLDITNQMDSHHAPAPSGARRPLLDQLRQDRQRRPSPRRSPPRRSPPRRSPPRRALSLAVPAALAVQPRSPRGAPPRAAPTGAAARTPGPPAECAATRGGEAPQTAARHAGGAELGSILQGMPTFDQC